MSQAVVAKIENITYGRDFIGVVVDASDPSIINKKIFVPYVIPSELVKVDVIKESKNFLNGKIIEFLESSPYRIEPKCPLFYKCGGCHFGHIEYKEELRLKSKLVKDFLQVQAKISLENDIIVLGNDKLSPYNYRKRAVIHILENGSMGFFKNETHDVVEFEECLILSDKLNECFKTLKSRIKNLGKYFDKLTIDDEKEALFVVLSIRNESLITKLKENKFFNIFEGLPYKFIFNYRGQEIYKNFDFEESAGHFSQVNVEANKFLINFVENSVKSFKEINTITELYAGAGNFTFLLSDFSSSVTAVELDEKLVKKGKSLSKGLNKAKQVHFVQSSCEKFVKKNKLGDLVLLDPPRSGAKEIVKFINTNDTKYIIYISCNLSSLQRDLKELVNKGYKILEVAVLDMFPRTYHVETVAILSK